jgi:glucosamine--fructose-6-phosphate aminotransferase (isomerizing)
MCGIFGLISTDQFSSLPQFRDILVDLYTLSESRGHDASGIAVANDSEITVLKGSVRGKSFVSSSEFHEVLEKANLSVVIGHTRMETNGSFACDYNNQPVVKDGCVTIHNGIIVNDQALWKDYPDLHREFEIDTEIINSLFRHYSNIDANLSVAVTSTLKLLEGSYSIATLFEDRGKVLLATNTGSLYTLTIEAKHVTIFTSEFYFAQTIAHKYFEGEKYEINQLQVGEKLFLDFSGDKTRKLTVQTLPSIAVNTPVTNSVADVKNLIEDEHLKNTAQIDNLRRCTKCILPETMPFIEFDEHGVCNYCRNYTKMEIRGVEALNTIIEKYRRTDGKPDCMVMFSGGRDSSYGLHYIKNVLKLNPVSYSYDWGMLTDLGRRNQARMTGELGIEHILISADIQKKRENIRKNVEAWLKRPRLGTVPLFMAGDKQFFYYVNLLKKQMNIELVFQCENLLEKTDFKSGFCNVRPSKLVKEKFYALPVMSTLRMMFYYAQEYLRNSAYINTSLLDSIWAYQSYYFLPHDYVSFYRYVRWEEDVVEDTLINRYKWELADDTTTTWRIGDGTAAFYNFIYYTIAGFSENDTFRSNQIREGVITREKALEIAKRDNKPRLNSLVWYANTIGINLKDAIAVINGAEKLYGKHS